MPHLKVDVHKLVTYLNQTPIFEWYVFRSYSKMIQRDVCLRIIGLHAQNMIIVLDLTIKTIGETYMTTQ